MRKTLSAILAVLLAALLCACGNTAPASKSESSVSTITSSAASEGVSNPTGEEAHETVTRKSKNSSGVSETLLNTMNP